MVDGKIVFNMEVVLYWIQKSYGRHSYATSMITFFNHHVSMLDSSTSIIHKTFLILLNLQVCLIQISQFGSDSKCIHIIVHCSQLSGQLNVPKLYWSLNWGENIIIQSMASYVVMHRKSQTSPVTFALSIYIVAACVQWELRDLWA